MLFLQKVLPQCALGMREGWEHVRLTVWLEMPLRDNLNGVLLKLFNGMSQRPFFEIKELYEV